MKGQGWHGPHPKGPNYDEVVVLTNRGWLPLNIAEKLGVSHQRVYQLLKRAEREGHLTGPRRRGVYRPRKKR